MARVSIPHQSFLEILSRNNFHIFEKEKIEIFVGFCRKMSIESNNTGVLEFGQVAAPIVVAQASMVHTPRHVYDSPREKLEKFNGLNFKRWQ